MKNALKTHHIWVKIPKTNQQLNSFYFHILIFFILIFTSSITPLTEDTNWRISDLNFFSFSSWRSCMDSTSLFQSLLNSINALSQIAICKIINVIMKTRCPFVLSPFPFLSLSKKFDNCNYQMSKWNFAFFFFFLLLFSVEFKYQWGKSHTDYIPLYREERHESVEFGVPKLSW